MNFFMLSWKRRNQGRTVTVSPMPTGRWCAATATKPSLRRTSSMDTSPTLGRTAFLSCILNGVVCRPLFAATQLTVDGGQFCPHCFQSTTTRTSLPTVVTPSCIRNLNKFTCTVLCQIVKLTCLMMAVLK